MNVGLHADQLHYISLCTGGGGLDLGIELAIQSARAVCLVEREAFAISHLVSAMEEGILAPAPVWSDVGTFDGRPWRGIVDGIIGGIPCQPHSIAGLRLGDDDERDLWSDARHIIVKARPWFVLIENVRGMVSSGGLERVWRDLLRLGYTVEPGLFTASEVGAPHDRERVFILAVVDTNISNRECSQGPRFDSGERAATGGRRTHDQSSGSRGVVADAADGQFSFERWGSERRAGAGSAGQALAHAGGDKPGGRLGPEGHRQPAVGSRDEGFDVADAGNARLEGVERRGASREFDGVSTSGSVAELCRAPLADADSPRTEARRQPGLGAGQEGRRAFSQPAGDTVDDAADRAGRLHARQGRGGSGEADTRGTSGIIPLFPPRPSELGEWRAALDRATQLEPSIRRVAHGVAPWLDSTGWPFIGREGGIPDDGSWAAFAIRHRIDRLRMLGNGVVPLQAAYAIRTLASRLAQRGSAGAARLVRLMAT